MKNITLKKNNSVQGESEVWELINDENNCRIVVSFSQKLKERIHQQSHSFAQFISEQLNVVLKIMNQISGNYVLSINEDNIEHSVKIMSQEKLLNYVEEI